MSKKVKGHETIEIYNNLNNHQKVQMLQLILWSDQVHIYNDGRYGCELFEFIDCNLNGATIDLHIEQDKDDDEEDDDSGI